MKKAGGRRQRAEEIELNDTVYFWGSKKILIIETEMQSKESEINNYLTEIEELKTKKVIKGDRQIVFLYHAFNGL